MRRRMRAVQAVNEKVLTATGVSGLLQGGFTMDKLKEQLQLPEVAALQGSDQKYLTALYTAAASIADRQSGSDKDKQAVFAHMVDYLTSPEGMSNEGVQDALNQVIADGDARGSRIEARLTAYAYAGKDLVDKLYAVQQFDERGIPLDDDTRRINIDRQISDVLRGKGRNPVAVQGALKELLIANKTRNVVTPAEGVTSAWDLFEGLRNTAGMRDAEGMLNYEKLSETVQRRIKEAGSGGSDKGKTDQQAQWQELAQILRDVNNVPGGRDFAQSIFELLQPLVGSLMEWLDKQKASGTSSPG